MWSSRKFKILVLISALFLMGGCSNIFESTANKTTDDALFEDATKANTSSNFDTAIPKIKSMSTAKQSQTATKQLLAYAYAGKCGFNFITYYNSASSGNGSTAFFLWLMQLWKTTSTDRTYCKLAETTMKSITPTYVGRSQDDSLFMVFLGLAKAGIYLRELADTDRDGVADNPPFDGTTSSFCSSANITDANIAEIAAGVGIAIANSANVSSYLGSFDVTSTLGALCSGGACSQEDEATIQADATYLKTYRILLNNQSLSSTGVVNGAICP